LYSELLELADYQDNLSINYDSNYRKFLEFAQRQLSCYNHQLHNKLHLVEVALVAHYLQHIGHIGVNPGQ
jgi:hypothetical protein